MAAQTVHVKAYNISATDEQYLLYARMEKDDVLGPEWVLLEAEDRILPGRLAAAIDLLDIRRPHDRVQTMRDLGYEIAEVRGGAT